MWIVNADLEEAIADEWKTIQELYQPENWVPQVQKSADGGSPKAQFEMGIFYEFGVKTLGQDPRQAVEWYRKAAAQGHPLAKEGLEDLSRRNAATPELDAAKLYTRRQARLQSILSHVLSEMDEKAKQAIKEIKAGN